MTVVPNVGYHRIFPVCFSHTVGRMWLRSSCLVTTFVRRAGLLEEVCWSCEVGFVFFLVKVLEGHFSYDLPIIQDQWFKLNHCLVLSTSYNDGFRILCMRFYSVTQPQFMVEFQHGGLLMWGPLLSPSMGCPILGEFKENAQEPTVRFNVLPAA
jgi:hypothetical protein